MDWFALGGVLIDEGDLPRAVDQHRAFMEAWGLDVPLHSTKIRGRRKEFAWLGRDANRAARFYSELKDLLLRAPVLGIACVIDRPGYNARYAEKYGEDRWLMCKTAYAILIERALKHARSRGAKLEVFFEEVGKHEDRQLREYHRSLKKAGMPFDQGGAAGYENLKATDFAADILGDPLRLTKKSALIQIADLYLYPIVKAGYDDSYSPYQELVSASRVIDALLAPEERSALGVKYSCFDLVGKK
jgi:hypothetical protein